MKEVTIMKPAKDFLRRPFTTRVPQLLVQSIIIGLIIGMIVSIFRFVIDKSIHFLYFLYPYLAAHPQWISLYTIFTFFICILVSKIIKPYLLDLSGSGIPQVEATLMGEHEVDWFPVLWRKFVGCLLVSSMGLFLGREGPCIQMGALVGQGFAENIFECSEEDRRLLQCAGIAAGLSAAVSAPLAGVFFLIEVITHSFKPKECISALGAAASADLVTIIFFGTRPCLYLPIAKKLPVHSYWSLITVGIVAGLMAYGYQRSLLNTKWLFNKLKIIPMQYHSIVPLLLVIPIGLAFPHVLGGSHYLIDSLFHNPLIIQEEKLGQLSWILIPVVFFLLRLIFSMISYCSSIPGGTFMPILVLGALMGTIFATVFIHLGLIPTDNYTNIIIVSMAAYLGAILRAPFTAIILLTEMIGTVEQVLPMIMSVFIAYLILALLGGEPIYTVLRKQMGFK